MKIKSSIKIDGQKELENLLKELPKRVIKSKLRQAMNAAGNPILRAARSLVQRDTGLLKKSLKKKVKTYSNGNVAVIIGADRSVAQTDSKGRKHVPANYAHLVEGGHGGLRQARAYPFMRPAYENNKAQAVQIASQKLKEGVESAAAKLGKK